MTVLAAALALVVGCTLAIQTAYITDLRAAVHAQQGQLCAYQAAVVQVLGQLGYDLPLIPPGIRHQDCPP